MILVVRRKKKNIIKHLIDELWHFITWTNNLPILVVIGKL
jgi:hypothetical protein